MASDICEALGLRIRELRAQRGWRQIDLAEEAGIHENYVSDLEQGRKEICLRTLRTISPLDREIEHLGEQSQDAVGTIGRCLESGVKQFNVFFPDALQPVLPELGKDDFLNHLPIISKSLFTIS